MTGSVYMYCEHKGKVFRFLNSSLHKETLFFLICSNSDYYSFLS